MTTTSNNHVKSVGRGGYSAWQYCCIVLLLLAHIGSYAHVQKSAITRILFNPATSNIEIMHRFLIHDAEHAASLIFGEQQNFLESAESRELFSSYVTNRFAISAETRSGDSKLLNLTYVGSEVDGQFIWVYQEVADDPSISGLSIVHAVLRDIWPDQNNLVNIEKAGAIQTLNFADAADVLSIQL